MKKIIFILFIALVFAVLGIWAATELYGQAKTQEKGGHAVDISYVIVRDTIYIDRQRPVNKPWYSYEIESTEDSIYLYSGRELIGVVGRKESTVFYIDSLIINDNL